MITEATLSSWTGPSSTTEQDKQDRTERMVREAVSEHKPFNDCGLRIYAKGSYPNNTNVKSDSDVDIGVQCQMAEYWDEETSGSHIASSSYSGIWTPSKLRAELEAALQAKFGSQVDTKGSTAVRVHSSTARVDADVVPCFDYRYYFSSGSSRQGAKAFPKSGSAIVNYPEQHLANGRAMNTDTSGRFKKIVRILKRTENAMAEERVHREVPSYFVECLVYNCPNALVNGSTWTEVATSVLARLWASLEGGEPTDANARWLEVNRCKYLFSGAQKWSRQDGRDFVLAAWKYLGLGSG